MKNLTTVHQGLRRLRGFRAMVRLGSAGSVVVSVALWTLAIAFLLDFWMRMGRLERGILLLAALGMTAWMLAKHLAPALRVRENDLALALLVERQQGLSSDLVAALQFADAGRRQFGSDGLREAVVDCTAEASASLNFLEGFSRERLARRFATMAISALVVVLPAVAFPRYSSAFLNRLFLLGKEHYPTRTVIERIESPPADGKAPYGQPVDFRIRVAGEVPAKGRVQLRALSSDLTTAIELSPDPNDANLFTGRLSRVLDDLSYTVHLGDAYTEPRELRLVPLPLVKVALEPTPPAYVAATFRAAGEAGRQMLVPEGSRVGVIVSADKKLKSVTVTVDDKGKPCVLRRAMKEGDPRRSVKLDPTGTPLERVTESLRFKVQVVDEDNMSLERPISGIVQVSPDRAPRIAGAAVSRYVLPTASPMIMLTAIDDYGISKVVLHQSIRHADANQTQSSVTIATPEKRPTKFSMWHQLKLAPLKLAKGDRVTVTLEAIDYRGLLPGRGGRSDPITFLVTDRQGLLEAMQKLDERMIEKLDEIIRAQLGIGD